MPLPAHSPGQAFSFQPYLLAHMDTFCKSQFFTLKDFNSRSETTSLGSCKLQQTEVKCPDSDPLKTLFMRLEGRNNISWEGET